MVGLAWPACGSVGAVPSVVGEPGLAFEGSVLPGESICIVSDMESNEATVRLASFQLSAGDTSLGACDFGGRKLSYRVGATAAFGLEGSAAPADGAAAQAYAGTTLAISAMRPGTYLNTDCIDSSLIALRKYALNIRRCEQWCGRSFQDERTGLSGKLSLRRAFGQVEIDHCGKAAGEGNCVKLLGFNWDAVRIGGSQRRAYVATGARVAFRTGIVA